MSEQYYQNVKALCDRLGISNPICEDDLKITAISFRVDDTWVRVAETKWNRAGRLFFQNRFGDRKYTGSVQITGPLRLEASKFFAENWLDAEENGRTMLIAFKQATRFKIHWK